MINFKSENEGQWFYFDENNRDAGSICLRELSTSEQRKIEMLTETSTKKVMRGHVYDDVKVDKQRVSRLTWQHCIVDWKNIQIDGEKVECNDINKEKLMKITDFVKFLAGCLEQLTETNKALDEARVKNLEPSSDGDVVQGD